MDIITKAGLMFRMVKTLYKGGNMKGGYLNFYNKQIKHSKKVLIEDLFGAYTLNEEYEREIKSLKKELEKYRSY